MIPFTDELLGLQHFAVSGLLFDPIAFNQVCIDEDVDNEQLPSSKVSIISSRVIMYQEHLFSETLILEKI